MFNQPLNLFSMQSILIACSFLGICVALFFFLKWQSLSSNNRRYTDMKRRYKEVSKSHFEKRKVMNIGEYFAFQEINKFLDEHDSSLIVCPQIPLLTIVDEKSKGAHLLHRGLIADFVLIDDQMMPKFTVEIDGGGHTQKNDAVKDKVLSMAEVPVVRVDTRNWNKMTSSYRSFVQSCVRKALIKFAESYNGNPFH